MRYVLIRLTESYLTDIFPSDDIAAWSIDKNEYLIN